LRATRHGDARRRISALLLFSLVGIGCEAAYAADPIPSVETIVIRMAQARAENQARLRAYNVTRNYSLFGKERQTASSEVIADVSFIPPDVKRFVIQRASGTRLGERIVRLMLEHETQIVKNNGSTDMSAANYEFRFVREEELSGQNCYVLEMLPRRKDKTLLRGQIWVDSTTYLLHRTEGQPEKAPSWWLLDARIVLVYGEVGGMWLQTSSESTADVRLLGRHTMLSRDLEYKMSELAAATGSAVPRRSR
jgi:outer membrane lipoprotein-sorting protein